MSNFYWLDPSWKQALCGDCGRNIWDDGGDPDWGYCYDCFTRRTEKRKQETRERRRTRAKQG